MISAVIFDLDGTVIDNEPIWEDIIREVAGENNIALKVPANGCVHEPGIGILNNWKKIVKDPDMAQKLAVQTWNRYKELKIISPPKVKPGLEDLVEEIKDRGLLTALATGSNWDVVEEELENLNLALAFDVTTTGDEITRFKPDPEIYLYTCQKMALDPEQTMAIEDSLAGVESAAAAGCITVGIVSDYASEEELLARGAKHTVANLSEVVLILGSYATQRTENIN